ncbi:MAG: hypothetical protein N3C59_05760 [Azovibrio sp.]|nr:hypothetical protein [Azovibrio sp.]
MADPYELPRLLARLKLQVRRVLNQSVDLEALRQDPEYARRRLAELEALAEDEELLVLILRLRELLCPPVAVPPAAPPAPESASLSQGGREPLATARDYRFGARAW